MTEPDDIRNTDEYKEVLSVLKKDVRIRKYFEDMMHENHPTTEAYQRVYNEFIEYEEKMIHLIRRRIKLQKIIDAKNNNTHK